MTSSQLPSADAAWLHMDSPANPMVVNAVIWFDEPIDLVARARATQNPAGGRVPAFPPARVRAARPPSALRGRSRVRRGPASPPARATSARRPRGARGAGERPHHPAARSHPAALARLSDRGLRRGLCVAVPHSPLHRRRHRARARDAVADGRGARRRPSRPLRRGIRARPGGRLRSLARPATGRSSAGRRVAGAVAHEGIETLCTRATPRSSRRPPARDTGTLAKLLDRPGRHALRRSPARYTEAAGWRGPRRSRSTA